MTSSTDGLDATLLAHGVGGRTDLPLAAPLAVTGALWAVAASFVAVTVIWPAPRSAQGAYGRPLPAALQRIVDNNRARDGLRLIVLLATALVVAVAFAGPASTALNLAPYAFYITFWVGLVLFSLLLGPIWRLVNPLRLLHRGLSALGRRHPHAATRPLPEQLGWWPATAWLALFVWLELVPAFRSDPSVVGGFLIGYAVVNLVAAQVYGAGWFDRGDGFEAYSTLVSTLSPLGRRGDGRLVFRNPLDGAAALRAEPGLLALLLVLIGATAFDGLTRTRIWVEQVPADSAVAGTAGLLATIAIVTVLYRQAIKAVGRTPAVDGSPGGAPVSTQSAAPRSGSAAAGSAGGDPAGGNPVGGNPVGGEERRAVRTAVPGAPAAGQLPGWFAPSLVPIAVGYAIAHYFSLFLFEGQQTWILASDPFRSGADYLGLASAQVDYTALSTPMIGYIQIGAILAGHIVGVLIAHDRVVRIFDEMRARPSQYPLMAVMLLFTGVAVALLVST